MAKQHRYIQKGKSVIWNGAWYKRKDGTWRNGKNGLVKNASGTTIGREPIRQNVYGSEKKFKRAGLFTVKKKR